MVALAAGLGNPLCITGTVFWSNLGIFLCHGATACGAWGSWKSLYLAMLTVPEQSHITRPESLVIVVLTVQQSQLKVFY